MSKTRIEWTDATWNPVAGCSVLTTGCTDCYAMEMRSAWRSRGSRNMRNRLAGAGNDIQQPSAEMRPKKLSGIYGA